MSRHYAQTKLNHRSSRSHTIFRLYVQSITNNFIRNYNYMENTTSANINNGQLLNSLSQMKNSEEDSSIITEAELNFIDLAGSEKISAHQQPESQSQQDPSISHSRERIKEGLHINKSLFFLTQVIMLRSEGKDQHVPYRNSPLTKILKQGLDGNSRTTIILCIGPTAKQQE